MITQCFKNAAHDFIPAFKRLWPWLLVSTLFDQLVSYALALLREKSDTLQIVWIALYIAVHFTVSSILVIAVNQVFSDVGRDSRTPLGLTIQRYFKSMFIESARVAAWAMLGLLLLVVPAVIWSVKLFWVIYVVQFDKDYEAGKVDALEVSRQLVQGRFAWTFALLFASVALDWGSQGLLAYYNPFNQPLPYLGAFALTIAASLYSSGVLFHGYFALLRRGKHVHSLHSDGNNRA